MFLVIIILFQLSVLEHQLINKSSEADSIIQRLTAIEVR